MNLKIHRGTREIGGSCVEIWTENTRILLDLGLPLVEEDGQSFNFRNYNKFDKDKLISKGILPDIKCLYDNSNNSFDGILLSHAHPDHYGLSNYVNSEIPFYLGEATSKIIELNNIFTPQEIHFKNRNFFSKNNSFKLGDFTITPYWADHSAFDAYSFLVKSNGKSIFYSGDFRSHGRKSKAFKWFTHNAPKNVDYLLLEGTTINRNTKSPKTEIDIENDLVEIFKQKNKTNLIYTSGQNIDRLTSIYKACKRANKILVIDVYVAKILKELSAYAKIPYPCHSFSNLRVMFPYFTCKRLSNEGNEKILYEFKNFKITKEEICKKADKIAMLVRPSMKKDLGKIVGIEGGNLIYSLWSGYLKSPSTKNFIKYLKKRGFKVQKIHTSGHAGIETLRKMVRTICPKCIIPIHTFFPQKYNDIFSSPVKLLNDGEILSW